MRKRITLGLLVALATLVLAVTALEGALRFKRRGGAPSHDSWMFFSGVTWAEDSAGAVRYSPDSSIRAVKVFGGAIEYDVRFEVNNLGFIDHEDYPIEPGTSPTPKRYVFVGDSFTAGFHGGRPWVPALRERVRHDGRGPILYNLGVGGTGFAHFVELLESVRDELEFDEIVVVAISDDIERNLWVPEVDGEDVWLLRLRPGDEPIRGRYPVATLFPVESSAEHILGVADEARSLRLAQYTQERAGFLTYPRTRRFLMDASRRATRPRRTRALTQQWMGALVESFPGVPVHFVYLPQRTEVVAGEYSIDLEGELASLGIHYHPALYEREWSRELFLPRDAHPNSEGYGVISDYVAEVLELAID